MNPRFSIIPAAAVTDPRIEARDLQVLCLLGRHIDDLGWCRRSQVRMAKELSCARSTVQASLERLIDAGWVEKRPEPKGPQGQTSHSYRVRLDVTEADLFARDLARNAEERKAKEPEDAGRPEPGEEGTPPADRSAPLPPQDRQALPIYGSAPRTTPVERKRERDSDSTTEEPSLQSTTPSSAREAYRRKWAPADAPDLKAATEAFDGPLTEAYAQIATGGSGAMGNRQKGIAALAELEPPELAAAVEACPRWLRALKAAHQHARAVFNYVAAEEWKIHPPPAHASPLVDLWPRSHEWCAHLCALILAESEPAAARARAILRDAKFNKPASVRREEVPSEADKSDLVKIARDSDEFRAWRRHLGFRGPGLSIWIEAASFGEWLWMPSRWPPKQRAEHRQSEGAHP